MAEQEQPPLRRVIGLDAHPTLFSAAALAGPDALQARVEWVVDRVPLHRLESVLKKKVPTGTIIALEASGNSFAVAARLTAVGLDARVLESQAVGKVGKAYCATDKVDAIKVGRVYLSGLAHEVWRPDDQAAERRELFFGHRNAVRDAVRARNRIWAFLNQQCLRRPAGLRLSAPAALSELLKLHAWTPMQQLLLREEVEAFQFAERRRQRLRAEIAAAVANDPRVLRLIRLLGVRDKVAFALSAFVGSVERFENPKKLVAYFGLNPSVSRSGTSGGNGGLAKYGRADVRALLIQAAQSILRHGQGPTHRWAVALKMRKGATIAVAALARKLVVSIWYLLKGLFTPLTEVTAQLKIKMHKIACEIGSERIQIWGFTSNREFEDRKLEELLRIS
ncbi:MAG: IS110 family transposase [Verrucomicrobia bacterium]|nr:IS110 family transposase [Verrucomicrobiota bacterium]